MRTMKKFFDVFFCLVILGVVLIVNALRFYKLDEIPYGFHVDEYSGAVTVRCFATQGVDAHNQCYPLFADLNYGTPKPPVYLYPAVLWSRGMGDTIPSLRALHAFVFEIGIVGLFFLGRMLFGTTHALWITLAAS